MVKVVYVWLLLYTECVDQKDIDGTRTSAGKYFLFGVSLQIALDSRNSDETRSKRDDYEIHWIFYLPKD